MSETNLEKWERVKLIWLTMRNIKKKRELNLCSNSHFSKSGAGNYTLALGEVWALEIKYAEMNYKILQTHFVRFCVN